MSRGCVSLCEQVLDKGPVTSQSAVLEILHCIVSSIDISTVSIQAINGDLLRVVTKYVEVSYIFFGGIKYYLILLFNNY